MDLQFLFLVMALCWLLVHLIMNGGHPPIMMATAIMAMFGYSSMSIMLGLNGGDIDGKTKFEESGTSVALSSNGNVLAVGGPRSDAGRVRVRQYTSGSWTQLGSDIVGEAAQDWFGVSVALSSDGTMLAVGASDNDPSSGRTNAGHVRVYKFASGVWTQWGGDIDGEAANDNSGYSVSLSSNGNVLAVGARGNDPTSARTDAGHVRVFQFVNNAWTQQGGDIDGEATGDYSGDDLSLVRPDPCGLSTDHRAKHQLVLA